MKRFNKSEVVSDFYLKEEISYFNPVDPERIKMEKRFLKVGAIVSDRLADGLEPEVDLHFLLEETWKGSVSYSDLDFILIESCLEDCFGNWKGEISNFKKTNELSELIAHAREKRIPVVFWFTADNLYHNLYKGVASESDFCFCADEIEKEKLISDGVGCDILLPAVQFKSFNPIKKYNVNSDFFVSENLVSVVKNRKENEEILKNYSQLNGVLSDPRASLSYEDTQYIPKEVILGRVRKKTRKKLLKESLAYVIFNDKDTSKTEQAWRALDAAASGAPLLIESGLEERFEFLQGFSQVFEKTDHLFLELLRIKRDKKYHNIRKKEVWNKKLFENSFSERLESICKKIDFYLPTSSCIKANFYSKIDSLYSIKSTISKYDSIDFDGKSLTIYTSENSILTELSEKVSDRDDIIIEFYPGEVYEGHIINSIAYKSNCDYLVFMDRDIEVLNVFIEDFKRYICFSTFDISVKLRDIDYRSDWLMYNSETKNEKSIIDIYSLKIDFLKKNPFPESFIGDVETLYCKNVSQDVDASILVF
ncbi:hypothetical protein [Motilimonas pumila]|uniref:DUF3880 domain-containing protein n=1 Tax=Motilimonas pumila TaxID=2303987 RepID=A0A418YDU4_9GAMM|nr:hypothetical protein [Motilimonas pumila]RJG42705.1 hypothetical protein D1Z90_11475 [Motilimonas pumila]